MGITVNKIEKWAKKNNAGKLLKALNSEEKDIRLALARALGTFVSEDSVNGLVALLRDTDPEIRSAAAESLGKVGNSRSVEFVRYLVNNDSDENVRRIASEALNVLKEKVAKEQLVVK